MITVTMAVDLYLDSISTLDDFRYTWRQSNGTKKPLSWPIGYSNLKKTGDNEADQSALIKILVEH